RSRARSPSRSWAPAPSASAAEAMRGVLLALCLLTTACGAPSKEHAASRVPVWKRTGLAEPESVAIGTDGRTLYVANVGGEGEVKDGNGFISRVSPGARVRARQWVTGLAAPRAAIVAGGKLYVSDIDRLVAIDIAAGKIAARYP